MPSAPPREKKADKVRSMSFFLGGGDGSSASFFFTFLKSGWADLRIEYCKYAPLRTGDFFTNSDRHHEIQKNVKEHPATPCIKMSQVWSTNR